MIGRTISHYRVVSQLGAGGMGVVYRAEDDRLGRAVALKFLPEELAHDQLAVERLRAEARAASALNHGNICAIYDIGEADGRPYIVMELLKGQNLRDRLSAGPINLHQLVDIGLQIADALDAAHGESIVHRDIKPANIFVTDRQQVKLLDFGVAKLTTRATPAKTTLGSQDLTVQGQTIGTIAYMSPEQAMGETLDGRSDLFSLGVVLYESATGQQPFTGKTSAVILSAILNRAPTPPTAIKGDLPIHLQEIIHNCLEKDRELRYQSAADLRADLKRLRREIESGQSRTIDTVRTSRPTTTPAVDAINESREAPTRPRKAVQAPPPRKHTLPMVAGVAAVVLVAAMAYVFWPSRQATVPATSAQTPGISDADIQDRIDQAAAGIAARLAEQAKQEAANQATPPERGAAPAPVPRPADRVETAKPSPASTVTPRPPAAVNPSPKPIEPPPTPTPTPPAPAAPETNAAQSPVRPEPPPPVEPPPAATPPPPVTTVASAPPPAPAAVPTPAPSNDARPAPGPSAEDDEQAMRRTVATYARAIETKSVALFRTVKPNLSGEEQRRLEEAFRGVSKQSVNVTILSITQKGPTAVVVLRRRDTIQAGGRQQQTESQQTLMMARNGNGWIITEFK